MKLQDKRSYEKNKRREYYIRSKQSNTINIIEYVNLGPLKSLISIVDKFGMRWFHVKQLLENIGHCKELRANSCYELKKFENIQLPHYDKPVQKDRRIKPTTRFVSESNIKKMLSFACKSEKVQDYLEHNLEQSSPTKGSEEDVDMPNITDVKEQTSVYEHITVESFKNIGTLKDLNNTSWFSLTDIYRELNETKFNHDKKQIFDEQYVSQLKDIPLTIEQWTMLKETNHVKDETYFVNEIGLNTLGGKLILLANRGTFPMADQQSQSQPSTSTAAPQEQELSITTSATFVQKQLSTLCDQYIQHITNPLIPFNVLPVLEYSQNLHAITDRSNEDDEQERPEGENENEETGNDEPYRPPSREDLDNEQQQIVAKYKQREDCRYEHVIPRTYEGDTGFFILLRINHRPGAYYVLRAQYKSLPGRFSILNKDLQRFPLGLTELLRIVTANPMRLLGHVAKRYESKVRRSHVTILELIESENEQTEPSWTEALLMEKIQALHEELVMSVDDVPKQSL